MDESYNEVFFECFYLFLREREREGVGQGGAKREGDAESEEAPGSELSAQSPTQGSNSITGRS